MGLFDVLDDLFDDLTGIFGGDDDGEGGDEFDGPPQQALPAPPAGAPPWGPALPVPNGPSGLQQGVDHAGTTYLQASGALTQTDDKLAGLLKQIFAANDDTLSSEFSPFCGETGSEVEFEAVAGTTYEIAVDGADETVGRFGLTLTSRPGNDDFEHPQTLSGGLPVSRGRQSHLHKQPPTDFGCQSREARTWAKSLATMVARHGRG